MKTLIIINAFIWAAVIFSASYLYKGSEDFKYLLGIMVIGFTLQNGLTYNFLKGIYNRKDKRN
ncbi:MAG TPA: hypothetical protein PKA90_07425 [Ignavibacteria bacterium]|nr:hypothetical protein [Ignavibacteria bacterium]HMR40246.1 hypothetical protein [Ignavibacteria bacterium]